MSQKLNWKSIGVTGLEHVYEKAKTNEVVARLLDQLEAQALNEAKINVINLRIPDGPLVTSEEYDDYSDAQKKYFINRLGNEGAMLLEPDLCAYTIQYRFTSRFLETQACSFLAILNFLGDIDAEKIKGFFRWTLELQVPAGGEKGLAQWETLIVLLFPWISVKEIGVAEYEHAMAEEERANNQNIYTFFQKMSLYTPFKETLARAMSEVEYALEKQLNFVLAWSDKLTLGKWHYTRRREIDAFEKILSLGYFAIVPDVTVCVDFSEYIPNCIALALLHMAATGKKDKQLIDAGEGTDITQLVKALFIVHPCCEHWECMIGYPQSVKIEGKVIPTKVQPQRADRESAMEKILSHNIEFQ